MTTQLSNDLFLYPPGLQLRLAQENDPDIATATRILRLHRHIPPDATPITRALLKQEFDIDPSGILRRRASPGHSQLVVQEALIPRVIHCAHGDVTHLRPPRLQKDIVESLIRYCWPAVRTDVTAYVKHATVVDNGFHLICPAGPYCVVPAHSVRSNLSRLTSRANFLVRRIAIPLHSGPTGRFSKYAEMTSLETISATEVCTKFRKRIGVPKALHSDHGTSFTSHMFESVCSKYSIHHTLIMHPQANVAVKHLNRTIGQTMAKIVTPGQTDWLDHLKT